MAWTQYLLVGKCSQFIGSGLCGRQVHFGPFLELQWNHVGEGALELGFSFPGLQLDTFYSGTTVSFWQISMEKDAQMSSKCRERCIHSDQNTIVHPRNGKAGCSLMSHIYICHYTPTYSQTNQEQKLTPCAHQQCGGKYWLSENQPATFKREF